MSWWHLTKFNAMQGVESDKPLLCNTASNCAIVALLANVIKGQSGCTSCALSTKLAAFVGVNTSSNWKNSKSEISLNLNCISASIIAKRTALEMRI